MELTLSPVTANCAGRVLIRSLFRSNVASIIDLHQVVNRRRMNSYSLNDHVTCCCDIPDFSCHTITQTLYTVQSRYAVHAICKVEGQHLECPDTAQFTISAISDACSFCPSLPGKVENARHSYRLSFSIWMSILIWWNRGP